MSFKIVVLRSFYLLIQNCFFFFDPKYFYEMAICCIIVIISYNNVVLYELGTLIKKAILYGIARSKLGEKLKPLTDSVLHIYSEKTPLISYVWILFSHIYSFFCDLDLF